MNKINQFFKEEISGEPLTEEIIKSALQNFGRLCYSAGTLNGIEKKNETEDYSTFLSKDYSEKDQEIVNFK